MNGDFGSSLYRQFGRGDRSKFFFHLEFVPDSEPGGVTVEEQASWGRFQIWADGRNLCAHYVDGVLYEHVTWYLLPLLEWLACEWEFLLHEQRFPFRNTGGFGAEALRRLNAPPTFEQPGGWAFDAASIVDSWARRHGLNMHREGGLFPDVCLRRFGEWVEVSWTADAPAGSPAGLQFSNGDGGVLLAPAEVARPLYAVLREAVSALCAALPKCGRIKNLDRAVQRLVHKDRRPVRVGILAGLGPDPGDWPALWGALVRKLRLKHRRKAALIKSLFMPPRVNDLYVSGECAGALMFGSVSRAIGEADALTLAELMLEQADAGKERDRLRAYARAEPVIPAQEPWGQGYLLAREWAETAQVNTDAGPLDIERHLKQQGVRVVDIKLDDTSIGAVAIARVGKRPIVAVNVTHARNRYPTGRRFTLAHELCHLLYDRARGVDLQIVSGEWAPVEIEKRANAFAAAFLMPDDLIRGAAARAGVDVADLDPDGLLSLARGLDVSPDALAHHLCNRRWLDEGRRDALLAILQNRPGAAVADAPAQRKPRPHRSRP
ncbi:MAG: ImmA/IrrE family metallo-endopeptidase [Kiritimatiellae bacterium]|nr:ImmA/IrrE family metallo-endopeptidase [Kiritimatiellia bacterium]